MAAMKKIIEIDELTTLEPDVVVQLLKEHDIVTTFIYRVGVENGWIVGDGNGSERMRLARYVRELDAKARERRIGVGRYARRSAAPQTWRDKPATERQIATLRAMGWSGEIKNRGDASNRIDMLRGGDAY